jgi:adenosine deaminase
VRAVESYDLTYTDLKQIARANLEHSFLPRASLWQERDVFTTTVPDCRSDTDRGDQTSASCAAFLKASEKAAQQRELERRFGAFEAAF